MTSDLKSRFHDTVARVQALRDDPPKNHNFKPTPALLTKMYGLYKQATSGDVQGERPSRLKPIERAKYDAHSQLVGVSREEAMQRYMDEVEALEREHGY